MIHYTSWLNGISICRGSNIADVRYAAKKVFYSTLWQMTEGPKATLKITAGARQSFVESIVLHAPVKPVAYPAGHLSTERQSVKARR